MNTNTRNKIIIQLGGAYKINKVVKLSLVNSIDNNLIVFFLQKLVHLKMESFILLPCVFHTIFYNTSVDNIQIFVAFVRNYFSDFLQLLTFDQILKDLFIYFTYSKKEKYQS